MADMSKLKRKGLGAPPTAEEASPNLAAPETAPAHPAPPTTKREDGRSLRASGRTEQFATRVTPAFNERLRAIAKRDKLLLVEVLEQALDAYEARK